MILCEDAGIFFVRIQCIYCYLVKVGKGCHFWAWCFILFFKQSICDVFHSTKLAFKLLISSFQLSRQIVYGISWSNPQKVTRLSFPVGSV